MRYFTAIVGSFIIFIGAGLISLLIMLMVFPESWLEVEINLGVICGHITPIMAFVIATLAATHSFRASLRVKNKKQSA